MLEVVSVNINDLVEDDRNPRTHDKKNLAAIKASLEKFGQVEPLVVQRSTKKVIGGNGRLSVMKKLGWQTVDVVFVDVDETKAMQLSIALNRTSELAGWDKEVLASMLSDLKDLEVSLDSLGFDNESLDKVFVSAHERSMLGITSDPEGNVYTSKIKVPTYEPRGDNPPVHSLVDRTKTDKLIKEINESGVSGELKEFLLSAAERHTVFRFDLIAEAYCHASADVQRLFESSALVIIDFDKAIENGFVEITEELMEIAKKEIGEQQ